MVNCFDTKQSNLCLPLLLLFFYLLQPQRESLSFASKLRVTWVREQKGSLSLSWNQYKSKSFLLISWYESCPDFLWFMISFTLCMSPLAFHWKGVDFHCEKNQGEKRERERSCHQRRDIRTKEEWFWLNLLKDKRGNSSQFEETPREETVMKVEGRKEFKRNLIPKKAPSSSTDFSSKTASLTFFPSLACLLLLSDARGHQSLQVHPFLS